MGLRVLNGRVVKVREWLTLGVPFPVLYRVYGQLVTSIMPGISGNRRGTGRKVFILEDQVDTSQKIRCHFQDIDRDLGTFKARESVVVVGRGMGDGMMQVFSVESFKPEEVLIHLARMENFAVRGLRLGMREDRTLFQSKKLRKSSSSLQSKITSAPKWILIKVPG